MAANQRATVAEYRSVTGWNIAWRGVIRSGALQEQLEHLQAQLDMVIFQDSVDAWHWNFGTDGLFSVKSARSHIDLTTLPANNITVRWLKFLPRKVNVFLWRLLLNRLPTRWNLNARGVPLDNIMCAVCAAVPDQVSHLFFGCSIAMDLWEKVRRWCQIHIPIFSTLEEVWDWIDVHQGFSNHKVVLEVLIGSLLWIIWTYRNATIFGDGSYRRDMLFDNLTKFSFNWYTSRNRKANRNWNQWLMNPTMN
ncbi:hypothetical protein LXL04_024009 [Taraxacum kok-saghyz]